MDVCPLFAYCVTEFKLFFFLFAVSYFGGFVQHYSQIKVFTGFSVVAQLEFL